MANANDTSSAHTPGDWKTVHVFVCNEPDLIYVEGPKRQFVADCGYWSDDRSQANAHIIASTLKLREACETFIEYADSGKHPSLSCYANTKAGTRMRTAVAEAVQQPVPALPPCRAVYVRGL